MKDRGDYHDICVKYVVDSAEYCTTSGSQANQMLLVGWNLLAIRASGTSIAIRAYQDFNTGASKKIANLVRTAPTAVTTDSATWGKNFNGMMNNMWVYPGVAKTDAEIEAIGLNNGADADTAGCDVECVLFTGNFQDLTEYRQGSSSYFDNFETNPSADLEHRGSGAL